MTCYASGAIAAGKLAGPARRLATTACYLLLEQDDLRRAVDLLERVRA